MREIGSYEAKTRLPELLKAVEKGEEFTITRRGAPIARLVPADRGGGADTSAIIARMRKARARRSRVTLDEILLARDDGRKS